MPRISGVNLVGVLLAAVAMYLIGWLWYGMLFSEASMVGKGMFYAAGGTETINWLTADGIQSGPAGGMEPTWMAAGFLISLALAWGLAWHMKQKTITKTKTAVLFGLWLSLLIGVPLMAYAYVYGPWHSLGSFAVDASHTVVTFVAACAVLSFFD